MSEKLREFAEIPQEFIKDGQQVCVYVLLGQTSPSQSFAVPYTLHKTVTERSSFAFLNLCIPSLTVAIFCLEFVQICKAVAVGFAVMGFIGYFVKLIHIPM